jgi:uncharacterized protein YcbK (DUF882 family)
MLRRDFLRLGCAAAVADILPPTTLAQSADFWSMPRSVWLYRPSTREQVRETYFADGRVQWPGYERLCRLLRDARTGSAVQMSPVLLDILCGVQGWLAANGIHRPLVTHSGYRTEATNAATEGAVRNSLHTAGRAWDGHVPDVSAESLARFGLYLSGGGVGFYQGRGFVHLDDGRLRFWRS